jgi:excisionase family DNA binding protein
MQEEKQTPETGPEGNRLPQSVKEPLLDSHQAAAILKVHPRTLQRLVHRGKIHAIQVGKLWRFRASAIEAWIER